MEIITSIPKERQKVVYFIENEFGRVKIGKTNNFNQRIKTLSYNGGFVLKNFFCVNGYTDTELFFHKKFKEKRTLGEWFELDFEKTKNEILKLKLNICEKAKKEQDNQDVFFIWMFNGEEIINNIIELYDDAKKILIDVVKSFEIEKNRSHISREVIIKEMCLELFVDNENELSECEEYINMQEECKNMKDWEFAINGIECMYGWSNYQIKFFYPLFEKLYNKEITQTETLKSMHEIISRETIKCFTTDEKTINEIMLLIKTAKT